MGKPGPAPPPGATPPVPLLAAGGVGGATTGGRVLDGLPPGAAELAAADPAVAIGVGTLAFGTPAATGAGCIDWLAARGGVAVLQPVRTTTARLERITAARRSGGNDRTLIARIFPLYPDPRRQRPGGAARPQLQDVFG